VQRKAAAAQKQRVWTAVNEHFSVTANDRRGLTRVYDTEN
jgi:hypothetical protein